MPLVAVGISQRELGPLDFSDFALAESEIPARLEALCASELIEESVVLSTCARSEVFAMVTTFHAGIDEIIAQIAVGLGMSRSRIAEVAHVYYDAGAVRHLFRLAGGLDSQILGESEIIGQVKRAYIKAHELSATGPLLEKLFQRALEVGKRVRTDTSISRGVTSSAYAATELLVRVRPELKKALVVGAGEIGFKVTQALIDRGIEVHLANRTALRGAQVAGALGAQSVPFEFALSNLAHYEAAFFATGSTRYLVQKEAILSINATEELRRDLVLIDLGMPRNVDPELSNMSSVYLVDLDSIYSFLDDQLDLRKSQVAAAEQIIEMEVSDYNSRSSQAASLSPTIASFYHMAENIKVAELARFKSKFEGLDPAQLNAIEALAGGIVAKVLHQPVSRLKETSQEKAEKLAEALSYLFDL